MIRPIKRRKLISLTFLDLPEEILGHEILPHLPVSKYLRCRLICKNFNRIIMLNSDLCYKYLCSRYGTNEIKEYIEQFDKNREHSSLDVLKAMYIIQQDSEKVYRHKFRKFDGRSNLDNVLRQFSNVAIHHVIFKSKNNFLECLLINILNMKNKEMKPICRQLIQRILKLNFATTFDYYMDYISFNTIGRIANTGNYFPSFILNNKKHVLTIIKYNPKQLKMNSLSEKLRSDKDICVAMCKVCSKSIKYLNKSMYNDRTFIYKLVRNNIGCLKYINSYVHLCTNKFILSLISEGYKKVIKYLRIKQRDNQQIVTASILSDPSSFMYASYRLRSMPDLVMMTVKRNYKMFTYMNRSLLNNKEIVLETIKRSGEMIRYIPNEKRTKKLYLEAIRTYPIAYELFDDNKSKEYAMEAVKMNPFVIKHIKLYSARIITKELALEVVKGNSNLLYDLPKRFYNEYDIIKYVVNRDGESLKRASSRLKDNLDIVISAVKNNPIAYKYASLRLKMYPTIIALVRKSGHVEILPKLFQ